MNKSFEKFKRNEWLAAVGMSAAIGVFAGLFAVGAVLLPLKLCGIVIDEIYYALIGGGAGLTAFALALLFLRPNAKKIAKDLDDEYALHEKVQTAYEFSSASGPMVERQRADAYDTLDALPRRRVKTGALLKFLITGVAAFALFFTAAFVPFRNVAANSEDPPYEITGWEIQRIRDLIANVQQSALAQTEKDGAVAALEAFITALGEAKTESAKTAALTETLGKTEAAVTGANTYGTISSFLQSAGQAELAAIVSRGGNSFRPYTLLSYTDVQTYRKNQGDIVADRLSKRETDYRALFAEVEGLSEKLTEAASGIGGALLLSAVPATDPLYAVLGDFSARLVAVRDGIGGTEPYDGQAELDALFGKVYETLTEELAEQSYRGAMNRHIANFLRDLFGLPIETGETDEESPGGTEDDPNNPSDPNDDQPGGGGGSGDTRYGSDDEVYDPATGEYVQYGDILDEYSAEIQKLLREGNLTEEQRAMVLRYIEMLYGGIQAEE